MSLPDRNNPYSFDEFLNNLSLVDFYLDDEFLVKVVRHYCSDLMPELHQKMAEFSRKVSRKWKQLADQVARPEAWPHVEHYDAHNHRMDRIIRPEQTITLEKDIFGEGLFSSKINKWESFIKRYVLQEIGEAGVMCPIACTEGLIALIEEFPDGRHTALSKILEHCKEGRDGDFGIGAQFMTEIQGGSDIPANLLEAEPDGDHYRIFGSKFFCSAAHADYSVITAKVTGSEEVGTFIVPSWLPGDKILEKRNNYRINRIKWKLGTCELPTAEIEYDGSIAYAVGPTNRGVANAVGIVLTLSRITVAISSAAAMARVAREARMYSHFRETFGRKIHEWPLAAAQLEQIEYAARRTTAGLFKVYDLFIRLGSRLQAGLSSKDPLEIRKKKFDLRELIILQKLVSAYDATDVIRKAISIFGGHGVIEDFSSLPRLFRDATVNELWEGPRNVLLMQVHRDLQRASSWYPPEEFIESILRGIPSEIIKTHAATLKNFLEGDTLTDLNSDAIEHSIKWEKFCDNIFKLYQEQALKEIS
ncbi:MAG: acyl-CoA dehydrogenase family protein [Desulfomonilaceae bacterium]